MDAKEEISELRSDIDTCESILSHWREKEEKAIANISHFSAQLDKLKEKLIAELSQVSK